MKIAGILRLTRFGLVVASLALTAASADAEQLKISGVYTLDPNNSPVLGSELGTGGVWDIAATFNQETGAIANGIFHLGLHSAPVASFQLSRVGLSFSIPTIDISSEINIRCQLITDCTRSSYYVSSTVNSAGFQFAGNNPLFTTGSFSSMANLVPAPTTQTAYTTYVGQYTIRGQTGHSGDTFTFTPADISLQAVASAVPEPATWAMMIGGFGMVGGAMRRRKSKVTASVRYA